jgi:glycerate dehydrogenase
MMQIVFLDRATLNDTITLKTLSSSHQWRDYPQTSAEQIVDRLKDADIVVVNKVVLSASILEQLPKLKLIAIAATGTNNVDLPAAKRLGIAVCNIRDYAGDSLAEHALAMMFALRRNLIAYRQDVLEGRWQAAEQFCFFGHPIDNLSGQTLGIIGAGSLGQSMAKLCQGIGMKVLLAERKGEVPRPGRTTFETVLQQADVISLHCPLTDATRGLIKAPELAMMKSTALLINTARGGIVNEADLLKALEQGLIAGAASDVVTQEPPPLNNPMMQAAKRSNFILTPHIAWASQTSMQCLADQLIDNIRGFIEGQPTNLVGV